MNAVEGHIAEMRKSDNNKYTIAFDPPVRITDDGRQVQIAICLPGIVEEEIRIDLEKTTITLSIAKAGKTIRKAIRIPSGVQFLKKKFSDGVLEIFLVKNSAIIFEM